MRGRVDRLERDGAGRLVIVDVKTGKTPVSKDDAQQHAQLAMYQLAVAEGLLGAGRPDQTSPAVRRLVYLGKTGAAGATEREQDPLTPAGRDHWRDLVAQAADATAGPQFIARRNDGCSHCPVRPSLPGPRRRVGAMSPTRYSPTELAGALGAFPAHRRSRPP